MPDITITLRITLPEGAAVSVVPPRPGGASGAPARPAADPGVCPDGHGPWHFVPAGVSQRTGNSFPAFWGCSDAGCRRRPPKGWAPKAAAPVEEPEEPYWASEPPVEVPF